MADPVDRAMVLLGINCGMYPKDMADLPRNAVDLERAWIDFPRMKTALERECPLWPETVAALREAIDAMPRSGQKEAEGRVFRRPEDGGISAGARPIQ